MGGGSRTEAATVPAYIEEAARANLAKAGELAQTGYTPYYGPDVAAFTPMQEAAFQGTNLAASAFGLPGSAMGMPAPTTYAGGVRGYSSAPLYEGALRELQARMPGQFERLLMPFVNPITGAPPRMPFGAGGPMMGGVPGPFMGGAGQAIGEAQPAQVREESDRLDLYGPQLPPLQGPINIIPARTFGEDLRNSLLGELYNPPGTLASRAIDRMTGGLMTPPAPARVPVPVPVPVRDDRITVTPIREKPMPSGPSFESTGRGGAPASSSASKGAAKGGGGSTKSSGSKGTAGRTPI